MDCEGDHVTAEEEQEEEKPGIEVQDVGGSGSYGVCRLMVGLSQRASRLSAKYLSTKNTRQGTSAS